MSGYELKKQLSVKLGAFWRVSFGSLYPCLKRLLRDGALEVEENHFTSRKKHVYRLTERGACPVCSYQLQGRFGAAAGSFGRRRIPITIASRAP